MLICVYDEVFASGIAAPIDILTAANRTSRCRMAVALRHSPGASKSPDGKLVQVDGKIAGHAACDAVILTAPFVADIAAFLDDFVRPASSQRCVASSGEAR